jgi:hypothetical protein
MDDDEKVLKACSEGNLSIIKNMQMNGYVFKQSALETASEKGHMELVQYLVETCGLKALANNREAMKRATNNGHAKIFFYLQKKSFEEINAPRAIPSH